MRLSDAKVKAATLPIEKKQLKLSDGGGLYLLVSKTGKYWRMNYRFSKKQKTLALGTYPATSLKFAREKGNPPEKQVGLKVEFSRMIYQGDFT